MSRKIDQHEARALEEALKETPVKGKDRRQAWALLRESGLDAALDFLSGAQQVTQLQSAVPYRVWGREHIDSQALLQMDNAARLPVAVAGALMPDAHLGYGLPIGGVLATDNAVIPYAVGVDIACRMRLTVFDVDEQALTTSRELLKESLMSQTRFGAGAKFEKDNLSEHDVLDRPEWRATPMLRDLYDTAIPQLGTSGGGNHFVEWGLFTLDAPDEGLSIGKPGTYLALLSHSGSRGVGFKIANHYSKLAMAQHPGLPKEVQHLAWFALDSEAGEEYWLSMELAGAFAAANHAVIHQRIAAATGFDTLAAVENHHNFAWREELEGKEVIVHRKGATPAGKGVLGVIPGSMGDPGYIVRGTGNTESVNSASHGAGRKMSRREARKTISRKDQNAYLRERGIELLGGGLDEAPQAYKSIEDVMAAQTDLVQTVGRFQPKIVRMARD